MYDEIQGKWMKINEHATFRSTVKRSTAGPSYTNSSAVEFSLQSWFFSIIASCHSAFVVEQHLYVSLLKISIKQGQKWWVHCLRNF